MLERILNSNGQIVPETGFVGFVLHNWVTLAIVTMLLGFLSLTRCSTLCAIVRRTIGSMPIIPSADF